jgi:hypothetical protein
VVSSITVNPTTFVVTMLPSSYFQVTSPTYQQMTVDNPGLVASNTCITTSSILTLSSPSSSGMAHSHPYSHHLLDTERFRSSFERWGRQWPNRRIDYDPSCTNDRNDINPISRTHYLICLISPKRDRSVDRRDR